MTLRNATEKPQKTPDGVLRQRSGVTVGVQNGTCFPVQTITAPLVRGEWSQSDFFCFDLT